MRPCPDRDGNRCRRHGIPLGKGNETCERCQSDPEVEAALHKAGQALAAGTAGPRPPRRQRASHVEKADAVQIIVPSRQCRPQFTGPDDGPVVWSERDGRVCLYCRVSRDDGAARYLLYDMRDALTKPGLERFRARLMLEGALSGAQVYACFGGLSPAEAISRLRGENVPDAEIVTYLFAACERGLPVDAATQLALDNKLVEP